MTRISALALAVWALPAQAQSAASVAADPVAATNGNAADDWSLRPRGRVQIDVSRLDGPAGVAGRRSIGPDSEVRRAYLGVDGTAPGGLGFRGEIDLASGAIEITDLFVSYRPNPKVTVTVGNFKPFLGLEDSQSDLFLSMLERASFTGAFGFERRFGLGAQYAGEAVLIQAMVSTADVNAFGSDRAGSRGIDGRVVFMPKIGSGQAHVAVSAHVRDFGDRQTSVRFRARPFTRTADLRRIDTGEIAATGERGLGAELAYVAGRFHATGEVFGMTALRPGLANPTFHGGYAEIGYFLTDDDTAYRGGVYDRVRPKRLAGKGGVGAIQINARYDWLDLDSGAIAGGRQQVAGLSVVWTATDSVRFLANYGHVWIDDAAVPAGLDHDYAADVLGMRAQFDF